MKGYLLPGLSVLLIAVLLLLYFLLRTPDGGHNPHQKPRDTAVTHGSNLIKIDSPMVKLVKKDSPAVKTTSYDSPVVKTSKGHGGKVKQPKFDSPVVITKVPETPSYPQPPHTDTAKLERELLDSVKIVRKEYRDGILHLGRKVRFTLHNTSGYWLENVVVEISQDALSKPERSIWTHIRPGLDTILISNLPKNTQVRGWVVAVHLLKRRRP